MLKPGTLKFLKSLHKNNNKLWFEENRSGYEEAKAGFIFFVEKLIPGIAGFDSTISDQLEKNCIFRINRDVRFSKNKTPYKNHVSAYFNKAGKKGNGAGYYLHIESGKSFAAAGIWMPEKHDLAKIRQEIDYNLDEWKEIINKGSFRKIFVNGPDTGNILTRPPKGYTEDNPALPFLKLKSFVVTSPLSDDSILKAVFIKDVMKIFRAAYPVVNFLNRSLE